VKVRIVKWSNVLNRCKHDLKMLNAFEDFRRRLKYAEEWTKPQDIIEFYQNSDLVSCEKGQQSRIVFNIGLNKYRMICGYHFGETYAALFIKFVGTHKEYDKVDTCTINMFK